MTDTPPHTVIRFCKEFRATGYFLQLEIKAQYVDPHSSLQQSSYRTGHVLTRVGRRVEAKASFSQDRTAAVQCGFHTNKLVMGMLEPEQISQGYA
ncbi:hypothetical protein AVEN_79017-1 [Araneus ventricosus]|uniref:Uncharacterized protein n=1 Tax=Araneus ventricosus TaxID=182803 RepID=A0A4Y2KWE6_ARAVE|nr:hypothetical protein AVEN_79017-1 [Araneus ventricosus]